MDLATLAMKLKLDSSEFDKGLKSAEDSGKGLGTKLEKAFSTAGKVIKTAISVAAIKKGIDAFVGLANSAAEAGDKIDKQSQALGMSRKEYQEWDYILSQSGADIDSLGTSMKTLNNIIQTGSEDSVRDLQQLGLSLYSLQTKDQATQFEKVVEAFQKMPEGAKKSALAVKLFGRNGQELLPLLNSSSESIDELRKKAHELGLVMSDEDVDAAVKYSDAMDTMNRTFDAFKNKIGAEILPVLTDWMEKITSYAGELRKAYDEEGFAGVWQKLVNDVSEINWPSWEDVSEAAMAAWKTIKEGVAALPKVAGKLIFGADENGEVNWPSMDTVRESASKFWTDVLEQVSSYFTANFSILPEDPATAAANFKTWWNEKLLPMLKDGLNWTLALFGVDDIDTLFAPVSKKFQEAGEELKQYIFDPITAFYEEHIKPIFDWVGQALQDIAAFFGMNTERSEASVSGEQMYNQMQEDYTKGVNLREKYGDAAFGIFNQAKTQEFSGELDASYLNDIYEKLGALGDAVSDTEGSSEDASSALGAFAQAAENATSAANSAAGAMASIPASAPFRPHAKGLWDVPYDNYPAMLHRGERVLTASQARHDKGGGVDAGAIASAVSEAVRQAMSNINMRAYVVEREVTNAVNRGMSNDLKARRFAT